VSVVGNLLVWIGFAVGLGAVGWLASAAATRGLTAERPSRPAQALACGGAGLLLASLLLPWIQGPAADTGEVLVLAGWEGLDPLTVVLLLAIAGTVALVAWRGLPGPSSQDPPSTPILLGLLTGSASALVTGNLLVQADQPGGSRVAVAGFAVALAGVALVGCAAVVARSSLADPSGRP
jgi:hypothetical protein